VNAGNFDDAKEILDKTRKALNDINTSDAGVYSSFYYACTEYNRIKGNPEEYYKNALQYLEYTDITALEPKVKVDFAYKFGLSALIGKENYLFGELLEHPIIEALHGSQYEWLGEALSIFNNGSIPDWLLFQEKYKDILNNVPELVNNIPLLEQKIAIMSIITLFFGLESVERIVPLSSIGARIGKNVEKVEMLLMRCMSLGFIKGQIDQVTGFIEVEWVQPRVLNLDQISLMGSRFSEWINSVDTVLEDMEANVPQSLTT
jgi:26S proteasome regulatory subunit N9